MRMLARWTVLYGIARVALTRWAKQGDPLARLIMDQSLRADPYPMFDEIRAVGDLTRTNRGYITTSHHVVQSVLRSENFRTVSVSGSVPPPLRWLERATRSGALHPLEPPSLLTVEPPSHTRYRKLVSSVFTARAVAAMRDDVQTVADRLLDELAAADGGPLDIVERYCAQLPVAVISDILGVDERDRGLVLDFGEHAAPSLEFGLGYRQFRDVDRGLRDFDRWLTEHMARLRRDPGDDLMSQLIAARVDGEQLNDAELRATAGLVLAAGFETTVNLLGNGVRLLLDHPDQLAALRADPELWPNAVDEILRLESPVQVTGRVSERPVELAGRRLEKDTFVSTVLAGANRDPAVFDDPHRFDVRRPNASKHVSFSGGRHFCLGAALARLEGEIGLRSLFERFPELADGGAGVRRTTRVLRGWTSLPVRLGEASVPSARA